LRAEVPRDRLSPWIRRDRGAARRLRDGVGGIARNELHGSRSSTAGTAAAPVARTASEPSWSRASSSVGWSSPESRGTWITRTTAAAGSALRTLLQLECRRAEAEPSDAAVAGVV